MKKNSWKYNENKHQDFEDEIDLDSGEYKQEKKKQSVLPAYKELIEWSTKRRGKPFMPGSTPKMYKAFAAARTFGLTPGQLKSRWVEMESDRFWQEKGFDWMNVVYSFNKKPR